MKKVLVFGTFDPLHDGHRYLFAEAKKLGDHLTVIVARDQSIRLQKQHEPHQSELVRLHAVQQETPVDAAMLGDEDPESYHLLEQQEFDVLAVGYDQRPSTEEIKHMLERVHKEHAEIVRLQPYKPDQFKSSLMRKA